MNIPDGYDIIAEGICTFDDSPKYYLGFWYFNEVVDIYYFILVKDIEDDDEDKEPEIYPVEEENMVYDEHEVLGWFSKTMETYTFAQLPSDSDEDEEPPGEGTFWQSLQGGEEEEEEEEKGEEDVPVPDSEDE